MPRADTRIDAPSERYFRVVLFGLCALYFTLELIYIARLPLVMDEFQGGAAVDRLRSAMPYTEFAPYKTILGYYLQLPAMLLGGDTWRQLLRVKQEMALVAAVSIYFAGAALGRLFRRDAALLAVALWICVSSFLERSAELRVDMLTGIAGLFSFLLVLQRRPVWAAIAAGLSFLLSQKGAYFCVAGGLTFGSYFLNLERSRRAFRDGMWFGVALLCIIASYVLVFSLSSSFEAVLGPTFVAGGKVGLSTGPYPNLHRYWFQTITRNPYFYAVAVLGIGIAFDAGRRNRSFQDWAVFVFGGSVAWLALWHRQPWPYFFVVVIPALAVCSAFFFDRILRSTPSTTFWVLFVVVGIMYPLGRVQDALTRSSDYQRYSVHLAETLLGKHDSYLAGVNIMFRHRQSPPELAWLGVEREAWTKKGHSRSILAHLTSSPPRLLFWNYRLQKLPKDVRTFLRRNYRHFSGAIRIYSPTIDDPHFQIAYAGSYELSSREPLMIDEQLINPGQTLVLAVGEHQASAVGFALRWVPGPAAQARLDPRFAREQNLFPQIYSW